VSKITDALAQDKNPGISFGNSGHPASRKEVASILAFLLQNRDSWEDLGADEYEIGVSIGKLIDSFE